MAEDPNDLPSQSEVEGALLVLLQERTEPIRPVDAYQALAESFGLTRDQRNRTMDGGTRNHWENRVQWARNELVKNKVMASGTRGLWALSSDKSAGGDWSEAEVQALIADYFDMLLAEVEGRAYSKTEHRNRLMLAVKRSAGAIERKHMNVSAVLEEHGYPRIRGYQPYQNYQRTVLPRLVLPYLIKLGEPLDRVAISPPIGASEGLFVPPPEDGVRLPDPSDPIARKFDIAKRDAKNRELGSAGEAFVVDAERQRLADAGRGDLAGVVDRVSRSKGDGLGYDILSCDVHGNALYIEVKTTRGGAATPFYITETERRVAAQHGAAYQIYRVFDFGSRARIFVLPGPLENCLDLRPTAYRAGVLPTRAGT